MNDNTFVNNIIDTSNDLDISDASPDTSGSATNGSDNTDLNDIIDNDSINTDSSSDILLDLSPLQENFTSLETVILQSNDNSLEYLISIDNKLTSILVILIAFVSISVFRKLFDCFR